MRYAHTNLIARDWKTLSAFYQTVFSCQPAPPKRDLHGGWLDRLTGMPGVHIEGEHLRLPGYGEDGPTLEIFSYSTPLLGEGALNRQGFSHIAFRVEDVAAAVQRLLEAGGSLVCEIVSQDYGEQGAGTFAYARDPEGNIVELQSWRRHGE